MTALYRHFVSPVMRIDMFRITVRFCFSSCIVVGALNAAIHQGAFAEQPASSRWAIVSVEPALAEVSAMLTVELSRLDGIALVERDDIQRVLGELQLTAGGAVEPDKALRLGQVLSAEAIVLVDAVAGSNSMVRARLVETRTGVRLWDWIGPRENADKQAAAMADELRLVGQKLRVPAPQRRYVGLIGVHSEEPGHTLIPKAAALTAMLDNDLRLAPTVYVLEREQLRRLRDEQQLTGIDLELRAATFLIEAGLRRDESGVGFAVNLQLHTLAGGVTRSERFVVPQSDLVAVRGELARHCQQLLGSAAPSKPVAVAADLVQEAEIFLQRAKWLLYDRPEEAVALAEAALALHPVREYYNQAVLAHYFVWRQEYSRLKNELNLLRDPEEKRQKQLEQLTKLLALGRRVHELDLAQLRLQTTSQFGPFGLTADPFAPHTPRLWADPEPPELQRLREEVDSLRLQKYQLRMASLASRHQPTIRLQLSRLTLAYYFAASPEDLCRQTLDWQRELDAEFARVSDRSVEGQWRYDRERLAQDRAANVAALLAQRRVIGNLSTADDEPRTWPADQLVPLWSELAGHEHPAVRAAGLAGLADLPDERGVKAALTLLSLLEQISIDDDLGFPPDGSDPEDLAVRRLAAAKMLSDVIDQRLTEVEQRQDSRLLWNKRPRFTKMLRGVRGEELPRRAIKLLDSFPSTNDQDQLAAANLRKYLVSSITPSYAPLPEDLRPQHPTSGPWAEYQLVPLQLKTPADVVQLLGFVVDQEAVSDARDQALLVFWRIRGPEVLVGRTGMAGGDVREIGRVPYRHEGQNFLRPITAITGPGAIFVNTGAPGLALLSSQGVKAFGEADGFPGTRLMDLEWLDGVLYLSLGNGLACFDPQKGTFRTLASSLSLDTKGPLDGVSTYQINDLLSDPARQQLWLTVNGDPSLSGVWKYTPSAERWERVFATRSPPLSDLWWSRDKIRFIGNFGWQELDPESGITGEVPGYRTFERSGLTRFSRQYIQTGDHIIGLEGQLYTPDGQEWRYPQRFPWRGIEVVSEGFLAHDANEGQANDKLILFRRRGASKPLP